MQLQQLNLLKIFQPTICFNIITTSNHYSLFVKFQNLVWTKPPRFHNHLVDGLLFFMVGIGGLFSWDCN